MKNLLMIVVLITATTACSFGQDRKYSKVKGELGLTGDILTGKMSGGGFGAFAELKYNVTDRISTGIRLGGDVLLGGKVTGSTTSIGARAAASFLAKGEYYLTDSKVRPFAGLGMGVYSTGSSTSTVSESGGASASATGGTSFGVMPQFGANFGSFRMALQYHILTSKEQVSVNVGQVESIGRNWLSFDLGFTIGGKRLD
ncbi:MAG: hypothetical protein HKN92_03925 [Chitinophagales bacterium]|nr:hypothetical protein [Chitinophagales bacterium]